WVRGSNLATALGHWRDVRAFLADAPASPERTALTIEACIQHLELGWRLGISAEEAADLFKEGETLATASGDLRSRVTLLAAYGTLRAPLGSADDSGRSAREATRLADGTDDVALQLATRTRLVSGLAHSGALHEALAMIEGALAEPPADLRRGADIL